MREELTWLEEQVQRAFEREAWHGPAVLEILAGVLGQGVPIQFPRAVVCESVEDSLFFDRMSDGVVWTHLPASA